MAYPASKKREYIEYHPQKRSHSREMVFKLNITSIIDIFTILIVFLLKSFSVQGELFSLSPDLHLPSAEEAMMAKEQTVSVAVTNDYILVNGERVEDLKRLDDKRLEVPVYPELLKKLQFQKSLMMKAFDDDPGFEFRGRITILGDKSIPFRILERVMYTCGRAEFSDINLAVTKEATPL